MITGSTSNIPPGALDWGDLRRMDPVSDRWGYDRGLPVDRYYIEAFMRRTSSASKVGSSRVRALDTVSSVVEYTTLSAARQISWKSRKNGFSAREVHRFPGDHHLVHPAP